MAVCPFYRPETIALERRLERRPGGAGQAPTVTTSWCAHLYSPVTKYVATSVAGGRTKLRCGGDLNRCQVGAAYRPKT